MDFQKELKQHYQKEFFTHMPFKIIIAAFLCPFTVRSDIYDLTNPINIRDFNLICITFLFVFLVYDWLIKRPMNPVNRYLKLLQAYKELESMNYLQSNGRFQKILNIMKKPDWIHVLSDDLLPLWAIICVNAAYYINLKTAYILGVVIIMHELVWTFFKDDIVLMFSPRLKQYVQANWGQSIPELQQLWKTLKYRYVVLIINLLWYILLYVLLF